MPQRRRAIFRFEVLAGERLVAIGVLAFATTGLGGGTLLSAPLFLHQAEWVWRPERSNMAMLRLMTWISLRLGRRLARALLLGISLYFLIFAPAARQASRPI